MTRMIVITRPEMADGFRLSGVDARAVERVEDAAGIIRKS